MSEEKDADVSMIEMQEEFIQHVERGGRKIRLLALIAMIAGAYFAINYFVQLVVLPYGLGIRSETVNLVDPSLVALGVISLVISVLWFYAGLRDFIFERRLARRVKEIRELQARVAQKYSLEN
jgi:hypothetical protein